MLGQHGPDFLLKKFQIRGGEFSRGQWLCGKHCQEEWNSCEHLYRLYDVARKNQFTVCLDCGVFLRIVASLDERFQTY